MGDKIQLRFKLVTGLIQSIDISRNATVLDAKRQLHRQLDSAPPHRQKLLSDCKAGSGTQLEDHRTLSSYPSIYSGCVLALMIKPPWIIYVQALGKIYEIDIPCDDPTSYAISDLKTLVEERMRQSMDGYILQFNDKPIEECRHGKRLTIKDNGIKKEDTIIVVKRVLNITSPEVDICFLVDCTSSMSSWIEGVKNNIKTVSDGLDKQYRGCDLRFAFVRYTDYDQPVQTKTTWIDFTKSIPQFHAFVSSIKAIGGGDGPEDIMGGLKITFSSITWRSSATKVLIHIADAPCHGSQYHSWTGDSYPNGDPAGITHQQMMDEVVRLDIQYWFAYIKKELTDQMIQVFNDYLKIKSDQRLIIRQVDGTIPEQLASTVHKSVTASVSANMARKVATESFDTAEPNWSQFLPQYGLKTSPLGPKSLQSLQDGFKPENPSISFSAKIATTPFADGEECLIYRGYDIRNSRKLVLKSLKSVSSTLDIHMKILEVQTIAATYANEFNCHKKRPPHLDTIEFTSVDVAQMNDGKLYIVQVFIDGKFEKFNTNSGIVCTTTPNSELMQAFSHFTYVHSGTSLLICDLQGVKSGSRLQLTDPAIHYRLRQGFYGSTDHGFIGIKRFFKSHICNSICCQMELEGTKA